MFISPTVTIPILALLMAAPPVYASLPLAVFLVTIVRLLRATLPPEVSVDTFAFFISPSECTFTNRDCPSTVCSVGKCENGACDSDPVDCDDNNPCTVDSCDPNSTTGDPCVHTPFCGDPVCSNQSCEVPIWFFFFDLAHVVGRE